MRIVYVAYMHPRIAPGGEQQIAFEQFQASLRQGHDAYFIAALEENHQAVYGKPGAPIVPVHGEPRQYFYFPQFYEFIHLSVGDWRSVQFFRELLEFLQPDIVHFHHYHRIGVESIRAARLAAPKAVVSLTFHEMMAICLADGQMVTTKTRQLCHAASPLACNQCFSALRPEFFTLRAERLKAMLAECDMFVFPSEFLADRYLNWGLPVDKCVVIANGQIDLGSGFDRTRRSRLLNRFGFFGQFIDNKGIDVILKALLLLVRDGRVPSSGIVVEINGGNKHYASETYVDEIRKLRDELRAAAGAGVQVIDHGGYERHELPSRMGSVDWVLVPSTWWEIFGLVVSEAWMFGRPVIASDIGGLRERIQNEVNGFTFPVRDARALADKIVAFSGDEKQWSRMNKVIDRPWTDIHMLNAHVEAWGEHAH